MQSTCIFHCRPRNTQDTGYSRMNKPPGSNYAHLSTSTSTGLEFESIVVAIRCISSSTHVTFVYKFIHPYLFGFMMQRQFTSTCYK